MKWQMGHDPNDNADSYAGPVSGTNDAWVSIAQVQQLEPGIHTLEYIGTRRALGESVDTSAWVVVFEYDSASGECKTLGRSPVTTTTNGSTIVDEFTVNIPVLVGSTPVYAGIFYHRLNSIASIGSARPGSRGVLVATEKPTASDHAVRVKLQDATHGTDLILDWDDDDSGTDVTGSGGGNFVQTRWKSTNGVIANFGAYSGTALGVSPPVPLDGRAFLLLRDVVVADGNTLTIDFRDGTASGGSFAVDMGATDQMTVNDGSANNISLPTINSLAQAGDTFDVAIGLEANNGGVDMYWVNKSKGMGGEDTSGTYNYRDITTISHDNATDGAARGSLYTMDAPETLYISGTANIGEIKVVEASKLFILLGDSQIATKNAMPSVATLHRLGSGISDAVDGEAWHAGIAGGKLDSDVSGASTAGKTRYDGTIGTHDLVEMVEKSGATLAPIMGVNDISGAATDDATAISVPATLKTTLDAIVDDTGNGSAVLFGIPPWSKTGADTYESDAIRNWNDNVFDLALTYDLPFFSPWEEMWDGTKNASDAFVFKSTHTEDSGLHYNDDPGGTDAAQLFLLASRGGRSDEGNDLGRRFRRDRRRRRGQKTNR